MKKMNKNRLKFLWLLLCLSTSLLIAQPHFIKSVKITVTEPQSNTSTQPNSSKPFIKKHKQKKSHKKIKKSVSLLSQIIYNFHAVEEGKLYRSQQLSPEKLAYFLRRYGIKTVINLRGAQHNDLWWHLEKTTTRHHNAKHHDISMSAKTFPTRKSLAKLLHIYKTAQQPILIHCLGGADRTGEAAAVWALAIQNQNISDALKHLSPWYRHFQSKAPKKREFIKMWQGIDWALKEYFPSDTKNDDQKMIPRKE